MDRYSNGADRHCYLPQAVEGFFTNGGKRVFIVRVLDTTKGYRQHVSCLIAPRRHQLERDYCTVRTAATHDHRRRW
jgi:hypothetical protein